jgi:hypothetical protein
MPRIIVESDDSTSEVVFWERVGTEDFDADHFRRCLCDRIAWAVADAEEVDRDAEQAQLPAPPSRRFLRAADPESDPDAEREPEPVLA